MTTKNISTIVVDGMRVAPSIQAVRRHPVLILIRKLLKLLSQKGNPF